MQAKFGEKMFNLSMKLLISVGFWKIMDNMNPKIIPFYRVYTYAARIYLLMLFVLVCIELYRQIVILRDFDRGLQLASTHIMLAIIYLKLRIYNNDKVLELLREGISITNTFNKMNPDIQNIVLKQLTSCNSVNLPIVIMSISIGIFFNIFRFFQARQLENEGRVEEFIYFIYNPLNKLSVFVYLENVAAIFVSVLNSALQTLLNTIIINLVTHIKVLHYQFATYDINETGNQNEAKLLIKLKELIRSHQKLISYVDRLNKSISNAVLIEYSISSLTIAFTVITISKNENVYFYGSVLLLTTSQLYVFCTNADDVTSESLELGTAIYNSLWYERSQPIKKIVLIVMMRTKLPLALKIGKFGHMNAKSMISICKAAHSYLSLFHGSN
ncbi:odorant receptor 82a-like [Rhynchophorus ferrugineus]|uniref:Odorant receptor n=1 Tax=Rhynchophorus ferrugineus TaxID=354439 RepID=A0A834HZS5_RHYFE|nr:hypothetical protein GWI33_017011 [Rhynchophorus ferrugineus]